VMESRVKNSLAFSQKNAGGLAIPVDNRNIGFAIVIEVCDGGGKRMQCRGGTYGKLEAAVAVFQQNVQSIGKVIGRNQVELAVMIKVSNLDAGRSVRVVTDARLESAVTIA